MASPVRVSLSTVLGGDLDGAWWPRTGSMVRELPDLIEALRPALGDVVDISVNWSAGSSTPVLSTMSSANTPKLGWNSAQQRLMFVTGRIARTKILVVPAMTSAALALMVLKQAAARNIPHLDRGTQVFETADRILQAARAASASWDVTDTAKPNLGPSRTDV